MTGRRKIDNAGGVVWQEREEKVGEEEVSQVVCGEVGFKAVLRKRVGSGHDSSVIDDHINFCDCGLIEDLRSRRPDGAEGIEGDGDVFHCCSRGNGGNCIDDWLYLLDGAAKKDEGSGMTMSKGDYRFSNLLVSLKNE
jgi:hypothetical protein